MRSRLPSRSPTTALIWASASRIRRIRSGLRLSGENIIDHDRRRYRGPLQSANGGYAAGRLAAFVDGPAEVTLRLPPPLDRPLDGRRRGRTRAPPRRRGRRRRGEARDAGARAARRCRSRRRRMRRRGTSAMGGGGVLRVLHLRRAPGRRPLHPRRAGGRDETSHAAPWVAREVSPEVVWAAIDCPGAYAVGGPGPRRDRARPHDRARSGACPSEGERCVVVAWPLGEDGRKLHAGTALSRRSGEVLALARQTWIAPEVVAQSSVRRQRIARRELLINTSLAAEPDRVQVVGEDARRSATRARRAGRARRGCSGPRARRSGPMRARGRAAAPARAASTARRPGSWSSVISVLTSPGLITKT